MFCAGIGLGLPCYSYSLGFFWAHHDSVGPGLIWVSSLDRSWCGLAFSELALGGRVLGWTWLGNRLGWPWSGLALCWQ
jgi:hypothetical protein